MMLPMRMGVTGFSRTFKLSKGRMPRRLHLVDVNGVLLRVETVTDRKVFLIATRAGASRAGIWRGLQRLAVS
jgi:hypothetical protein